jgi:arsenite methyltransferase
MSIQVFDKPMCCSTGICGPQVDQTLVRFAADLDWLHRQGVQVERYNVSQNPGEFAKVADVQSLLQTKGMDALPIIRLHGRIVWHGTYPDRQLLACWGRAAPPRPKPVSGAKHGCC